MLNRILKTLILADFCLLSGFGLLNPIFAVYLVEQIPGGTVGTAGIASGIYLLIRVLLQYPVARIADKEKGNVLELFVLTFGYAITALVPFTYIFAKSIWHIYLIQIVLGIGMGLSFPGWSALFTKFIKPGKEASTWSIYSSLIILGMGGAAAIGGLVAQYLGFVLLFVIVGVFSIAGCVAAFSLYRHIRQFE